jgi:hypothetical protein
VKKCGEWRRSKSGEGQRKERMKQVSNEGTKKIFAPTISMGSFHYTTYIVILSV